tara:strand:- start:729 stop:1157 length:429 start_codon:yes stop_codon:yes gene_type:complete
MIKYKLECNDCKFTFDSWFSSSKEFDKLKKINLLNCSQCNSIKIEKSLMSPQVISKIKDSSYITKDEKKIKLFKNKMREYQKFIKNNFDYVGNNFAYEARSIHYNKKKSKGIYGKASNEDINNLKDEGIEIQNIPWIEDKEN